MITISTNGKTYKVEKPEKSSITIEALISAWIKSGVLEEVKENKELDKALAERLEYPYEMTYAKDTSILEKLKDWVDKELKLEGYEHQQILDKIDSLTSLETPQFTPGQEEELPPLIERLQNAKPGSMIELSKEEMEKMIKPISWELDREGLSDSELIECMNKQLFDVTERLNKLIAKQN